MTLFIYILGGVKMGKRADNKAPFSMFLDKDLKAKFKALTTSNKDNMTDIVVKAIQNYIKEHGDTLQTK